jgi:hypothetical protein
MQRSNHPSGRPVTKCYKVLLHCWDVWPDLRILLNYWGIQSLESVSAHAKLAPIKVIG